MKLSRAEKYLKKYESNLEEIKITHRNFSSSKKYKTEFNTNDGKSRERQHLSKFLEYGLELESSSKRTNYTFKPELRQ